MRGEQSEGEKDPTMWLDVALGLQKIDKFEKSRLTDHGKARNWVYTP
jgi:hypothetical protein